VKRGTAASRVGSIILGLPLGLAAVVGCSVYAGGRASDLLMTATADCEGSVAELSYRPDQQRIEVRLGGDMVATADSGLRHLDFGTCERSPTQRGWFVGYRYTRTQKPLTLVCTFHERFFVHVHPIYNSDGPLQAPDASAVYLVVPGRRGIVASGSVGDERSVLQFARRSCRPREP
jgi:hypothetical protein